MTIRSMVSGLRPRGLHPGTRCLQVVEVVARAEVVERTVEVTEVVVTVVGTVVAFRSSLHQAVLRRRWVLVPMALPPMVPILVTTLMAQLMVLTERLQAILRSIRDTLRSTLSIQHQEAILMVPTRVLQLQVLQVARATLRIR